MQTVDSLVVQNSNLNYKVDLYINREKEKTIQLNLEKAKVRRSKWIIAGSTFGGLVVGVLVGLLIPK